MNKYERKLRKLAKRFGRDLTHGGKHWKMVDPQGRKPPVSCSITPSCHRAFKNLEKELERKT